MIIRVSYPKGLLQNVSTSGGEGGIRTPDTRLEYTRFPSVRLQPLGHFSFFETHDKQH